LALQRGDQELSIAMPIVEIASVEATNGSATLLCIMFVDSALCVKNYRSRQGTSTKSRCNTCAWSPIIQRFIYEKNRAIGYASQIPTYFTTSCANLFHLGTPWLLSSLGDILQSRIISWPILQPLCVHEQ
jgi:hypothetical protein